MTHLFNTHKPNHLVLWKGVNFSSDQQVSSINDAVTQTDSTDLDSDIVAQIRSEAYEQGWNEAEISIAQKIEEETATARIAVALDKCVCEIDDIVKKEILELSLSLARLIVNREIEGDVDFYARLVDAYGDQSVERPPLIRLNPDDHNRINVNEGRNKRISFRSDPAVEQGSCFLDTGNEILDLSTDALLADLMKVFTDQLDSNELD